MTNLIHGFSQTKLYRKWADMLQRCNNPKSTNYKNYGAKGVEVFQEWRSFENFKEWALNNGYKEGLTIDRLNPSGNYEPSNCKWSTRKEQDRNKRNTRIVVINGERMSLKELSERTNLNYSFLAYRYDKGIRDERILKPSQRGVELG